MLLAHMTVETVLFMVIGIIIGELILRAWKGK